MTLAVEQKRITVDELVARPDQIEYELIEGHLVGRNPVGSRESYVAARIIYLLLGFIEARKLGFVFTSELGYKCFGNRETLRRPDVSFISSVRLKGDQIDSGYLTIPPDLAIEVVSPNDFAYEVEQKVEQYLEAGIRMVWVVFPNTKTINIFHSDRSVQKLSEADTITAGDVIPGFSAPVRAIFEMPVGS